MGNYFDALPGVWAIEILTEYGSAAGDTESRLKGDEGDQTKMHQRHPRQQTQESSPA